MEKDRSEGVLRAKKNASLSSTAYDTAWIAHLCTPGDLGQPRFPTALHWILEHQLPDGSWGGEIRYEHDRVISTLAALRPLLRFRPGPDGASARIERAQRYLWQHAPALKQEPSELVAFELLLPTLTQDINRQVRLPPYLTAYNENRERKLSMLTENQIYSPRVTVVHSFEFLGDSVDVGRIAATQSPNGSIGNSPAATAYMLSFIESEGAIRYLRECLAANEDAAATVLYPCHMFDLLWSAYHRFLGGLAAQHALSEHERREIRSMFKTLNGVSLDDSFPIPDADDTAVALLLLHECGESVPWETLSSFRSIEGYYASFPYERHPSTGVNVHVLDALKRAPHTQERSADIERIIGFLSDTRTSHSYWFDKWHISPYYATGHAILALRDISGPCEAQARLLAMTALDWIRHTQNEDGSWGVCAGIGTAEETAYGLLALAGPEDYAHAGDTVAIRKGLAFLDGHSSASLPQLWIDKCLYLPPNIVQSALDAARMRARELEGHRSP